jgi:predicted RNA binding protein YcfA (HicA-like mRNA interferase family)
MSRLPPLKSKDIIRALHKIGFIEHRQRGSHKIFKKDKLRVTLPIHSKDLKKGTIHSIIEQIELTLEEFLEFLK